LQQDFYLFKEKVTEDTKKIHWFEMKLNKWIRLYETSEEEGANRHNSLITKVNEVETFVRKE
jgi:hypothetical protein